MRGLVEESPEQLPIVAQSIFHPAAFEGGLLQVGHLLPDIIELEDEIPLVPMLIAHEWPRKLRWPWQWLAFS